MPRRLGTKFTPNIIGRVKAVGSSLGSMGGSVKDFIKYNEEEVFALGFVAAALGIAVGMPLLIIQPWDKSDDYYRDIVHDVHAASAQTTETGQEYRLEESNVVILDSHESEYQFDFGTGFVQIDIPGKDDRVFSFAEFPNLDLIRNAQAAGLSIAESFNADIEASLSEKETEWLEDDNSKAIKAKAFLDEKRNDAEIFATNFHSGIYPNLTALLEAAVNSSPDFVVGPAAPDAGAVDPLTPDNNEDKDPVKADGPLIGPQPG